MRYVYVTLLMITNTIYKKITEMTISKRTFIRKVIYSFTKVILLLVTYYFLEKKLVILLSYFKSNILCNLVTK